MIFSRLSVKRDPSENTLAEGCGATTVPGGAHFRGAVHENNVTGEAVAVIGGLQYILQALPRAKDSLPMAFIASGCAFMGSLNARPSPPRDGGTRLLGEAAAGRTPGDNVPPDPLAMPGGASGSWNCVLQPGQ